MNVVHPIRGEKGATPIGLDAHGTERRAIVDTHRHPVGGKLRDKMAEAGLFDFKKPFPQTNAQDLFGYRTFFDLDYAMPMQREGGVTLSIAQGEKSLPVSLHKVCRGSADAHDHVKGAFGKQGTEILYKRSLRVLVAETGRHQGILNDVQRPR